MNKNTALVEVSDVVHQMAEELERLGNVLSNSPKIAGRLAMLAEDARVLTAVLDDNRATIEGLMGTISELQLQRNMALGAADFARTKRVVVLRELAQSIGLGAGTTQRDMERVLEVLVGGTDGQVDDELLGRVHEALNALAQELYEVEALEDSATAGQK